MKSNFRTDVHALRAIASILVLLFHINPTALPGGFVGVDIFYVISGFVIFRGLLTELTHFNAIDFYKRRFFRLFPVILFATTISVIFGLILLTPTELIFLSQSALAGLFSVSNFYFADRVGYFSPALHSAPLAHFWSLSVEEQFYLFTPLIISIFAWCRSIQKIILAVVIMVIISFITNYVMSYIFYQETQAFYFPFSRFWQIGIGILIAIVEPHIRVYKNARMIGTLIGMIIIIGSSQILNPDIVYPGLAALAPTMSAALFIACDSSKIVFLRSFYQSKITQFMGDISFSLYVFHWPLIVYWKLVFHGELNKFDQIQIVSISLALAFLSRAYIEKPFIELGKSKKIKRPIIILSFITTFTVILTLTSLGQDGFPQRLNYAAREIYAMSNTARENLLSCMRKDSIPDSTKIKLYLCGPQGTKPLYLLVGDSHAGMIAPQFQKNMSESGIAGLIATLPDCQTLFFTTTLKYKNRNECRIFHELVLNIIKDQKIPIVIIANRWANIESPLNAPYGGEKPKKLFDDKNNNLPLPFVDALRRTIEILNSKSSHVIFVASIPEINFDVPNLMIRSAQLGLPLPKVDRGYVSMRQSKIIAATTDLKNQKSLQFDVYNSLDRFCDEKYCHFSQNGIPYYYDSNHLNHFGSALIAGEIASLARWRIRFE